MIESFTSRGLTFSRGQGGFGLLRDLKKTNAPELLYAGTETFQTHPYVPKDWPTETGAGLRWDLIGPMAAVAEAANSSPTLLESRNVNNSSTVQQKYNRDDIWAIYAI